MKNKFKAVMVACVAMFACAGCAVGEDTTVTELGSFTLGALLGIEAPEPIEMPTRPTPPIYSTPITGY